MSAPDLRTATPADLLARQREEAVTAALRATDALARRNEAVQVLADRVARMVQRGEVDTGLVAALDELGGAVGVAADAARVAVSARARAERAGARL